ncbi:hypothetical protein PR048_029546 [Dryococelus australis]|uniref:Uncharacterized protein n=1 Tax=Dryococelus australis TaxID=614101 RepID=A0ABQ9GFY2_9NEOP|nr:hypothetical protein PR048_029546 [Dryococelus australis]
MESFWDWYSCEKRDDIKTDQDVFRLKCRPIRLFAFRFWSQRVWRILSRRRARLARWYAHRAAGVLRALKLPFLLDRRIAGTASRPATASSLHKYSRAVGRPWVEIKTNSFSFSRDSSLSLWGRGGVVDRLLASHLGGVAPGFSYVGIVPDNASGRRVYSEISRFPHPLHSGAAPSSHHFPLVGCQDLDWFKRTDCSLMCKMAEWWLGLEYRNTRYRGAIAACSADSSLALATKMASLGQQHVGSPFASQRLCNSLASRQPREHAVNERLHWPTASQ